MIQVLRNVDHQRSTPLATNLPYLGHKIQNIKSKLLRLFLMLCLFSFTIFYSQNAQAQSSGTYTFSSYAFNYTISAAGVVTIMWTTALPPGASTIQQIRVGPPTGPHSFPNMSGTYPTYTLTLAPSTPFIFRIAWESGGLFESPYHNTPALPITLSDFSTTKNGAKGVLLTWKTSSEINSDYFGIERSTDGSDWDHIGLVPAAGNSHTELVYSYADSDLPLTRTTNKIFYYRLRLTDLDGSFEYSDIRGINLSTDFSNISVYPNPTIDRINVDLSGIDTEAGEVKVGIYDYKGAEIMTKIIIGSGIELIDLNHLPSATYHIIVKQGLESIHQSSILKVK